MNVACSSLSRQCTGLFSKHTLILQIQQRVKLTKSRAPLLRAEFRTKVQLRVVVRRVANTLMPPPLAPLWFSVNLGAQERTATFTPDVQASLGPAGHAEQLGLRRKLEIYQ